MLDHLKTDVRRGPASGFGTQIVREIVVCEQCLPSVVEAPMEEVNDASVGGAVLGDVLAVRDGGEEEARRV